MESAHAILHQPYAVTALATCVLAVLLAVLVFWKNPRSPTARWWGIMCLVISIWAVYVAMLASATDPEEALMYSRHTCRISLFIPPLFLHSVMRYLDRFNRNLLCLSYVSAALLVLTTWTRFFISGMQWKFGMWYEVGGPAYFLQMLTYTIFVSYGTAQLMDARRIATGLSRTRLTCLVAASATGFGGGFMWFLPAFGIDIPPWGGHVVALHCIVITYAIVRYQVFDIQVVVRKSVVYSALVTMLTLGYFTVTFIGERVFQNTLGYQSLALSVVVFAGLALVFQPLKRWLQAGVDRWLMPEPKEALAQRLELLEQEIREADKARAVGHLAAGVAHEIRNPLSAIRTFLGYLPSRQGDPGFTVQFQQVVGRELDHLEQLAHGLVNLAKPRLVQKTPVDVRAVIDQLVTLTTPALRAQHIGLDATYYHNGAQPTGDASQLGQALLNLVLNAGDAMPQGGRVSISTRSSPGTVEIIVSDTGQGIAPADVPHLFEPFFTRKPKGSGLGLSIVHRIVQEHGGTIRVDSQLGRGTTFTIHLPIQVSA